MKHFLFANTFLISYAVFNEIITMFFLTVDCFIGTSVHFQVKIILFCTVSVIDLYELQHGQIIEKLNSPNQGHMKRNGYHCHLCGKVYKYNHHLKRHLTSHNGAKPFVCSLCGKSFTRKDSCRDHMRLVHSQY